MQRLHGNCLITSYNSAAGREKDFGLERMSIVLLLYSIIQW